MYNKYKNLHKPVKYSIKENTKIVFPKISKQFSESTIYLAFYKILKFNSGIVLNEEYKEFVWIIILNLNQLIRWKEK